MKVLLTMSAFLGAIAVILGAFAAHGLKAKLMPEQLDSFQVGVKYQMYHVLALMLVLIISKIFSVNLHAVSVLFLVGIFLFSGSIYLLSCREILGIESWSKILGPITPIGGMCLIIGWFMLAYKILQSEFFP